MGIFISIILCWYFLRASSLLLNAAYGESVGLVVVVDVDVATVEVQVVGIRCAVLRTRPVVPVRTNVIST